MRELTPRGAAPIRTKARPSRLADAELDHLENILQLVARAGYTSIHGLDIAYWCRRVAFIESEFELLPIQRSRVKALLQALGRQRDGPSNQGFVRAPSEG